MNQKCAFKYNFSKVPCSKFKKRIVLVQISIWFLISGKVEINPNQLIKTFQEFGPEFHVELDIVVYKIPSNTQETTSDWRNIFYISHGDNQNPIALLWLTDVGTLDIKFYSNGGEVSSVLPSEKLKLNEKIHIVFKQYQKGQGAQNIWTYTKIDDHVFQEKNDQPETFQNVRVYASFYWHAYSSEFGKVENMIIYQSKYFLKSDFKMIPYTIYLNYFPEYTKT